jgi:L-alanine-DL-glutamate epimerase-like enolase superfamily enzyme
MRIVDIEVISYVGAEGAPPIGDGLAQVNPIDHYPEDRDRRRGAVLGRSARFTATYLRLRTDGDLEALYGPVDDDVALMVRTVLRPLLVGRDPLAGERHWDRLQRSERHARHGQYMKAISAVDNLLWDARGRHFGVPVHRLLGGPTRDRVPAYATMLGVGHDPAQLASAVDAVRAAGFTAQKHFFADGPGDGAAGFERNVDLAFQARTAAPDLDLMFDAYCGWDRDYARRWLREAEEVDPSWLEEPLMPEQTAAYRELRAGSDVRIAAGEHLFGRWEAQRWLEEGLVDVLQLDPEWCGGVSELVKIGTVASLHGAPLIPHGHGVHASLHAAAALPAEVVPMIEYITTLQPRRLHFDRNAPVVRDGGFDLPELPGFGIEIAVERVESTRVWD